MMSKKALLIQGTCAIAIGYVHVATWQFITVYLVYLANNKFGELGCNAYMQTFQFGKQGDIECTLLHDTS